MVAYIIPDHTKTLGMKEKNGVIVSLERMYHIGGLGSSIDYQVLLAAYAQVGLPAPGSFLVSPALSPDPITPPGAANGAAMLVLAEREFSLVDQDKATVGVVLRYQHFMEGNNQNLGGKFSTNSSSQSPNGWFSPFSRALYGKNRASVQQTKVNFYNSRLDIPVWSATGVYTIGSVVDHNGLFWLCGVADPGSAPPPGPAGSAIGDIWDVLNEASLPATLDTPRRRQITLAHQYPSTDPQYPGQTKYQTGEITSMQPNDNFKLHGQIYVRNPRAIKRALVGAINSIPWMDGGAYEWMCMEVTWEPMYVQWQYAMSFEFQHNPDTWLPTAIFHDQRIGRPPANLVDGIGFKSIHNQAEVNFEAYFNQNFGSSPMAGA